jgi:integrase
VLPSDTPLIVYLEGQKDDQRVVTGAGWQQAITAKGSDSNRADVAVKRVRAILDACGFLFWRDLKRPGAATAVQVWLAGKRDKGEIGGATANYYMRELKSFCRWLAKAGHAPDVAMADLEPVTNPEVDGAARRALTSDEMPWLLRTTAAKESPVIQGLTGDERAFLYRFAFETGIRPGQMRALVVKDFDLDGDPPTVTTHAKHVKRRKTHTQVLRPGLAAVLNERFKGKMPAAAAVKMPSKHHMADMLRRDLASARASWIEQKGITDEEREQRQRSDFLSDVNHHGERAVFYSMRHGHGTALANAGVPEKDIAKSMHHASRTTTARYLHGDRRSAAKAVAALPDLS